MTCIKQFQLLGSYNQLMNQRLYEAVGSLSDQQRKENRGAFFGSLFGTLNHILVGDIIWLKRFSSHSSSQKTLAYLSMTKQPESLSSVLFSEFSDLKKEREKIDKIIIEWIQSLQEKDLSSSISYQNMAGHQFKKNYASLINHLFLHQVHHRGQATTLLSQINIDFGETDLIEMI